MTETELRQAYEMFTDLWRFYKRFCESSNTEEYWAAVSREANALREKYGSKLCKGLLLAVIDELERRESNEESTIYLSGGKEDSIMERAKASDLS